MSLACARAASTSVVASGTRGWPASARRSLSRSWVRCSAARGWAVLRPTVSAQPAVAAASDAMSVRRNILDTWPVSAKKAASATIAEDVLGGRLAAQDTAAECVAFAGDPERERVLLAGLTVRLWRRFWVRIGVGVRVRIRVRIGIGIRVRVWRE